MADRPSQPEVLMSTARSLTLADVALPRAGALENTFLIIGASLVTALAAQVAIPVPWSPVPITGQTFAVLLTGAVLGSRRAFIAQALYLIEGAAGLPVFAGGAGSAAVLLGPTGGYLAAFPLAAALVGWLAGREWDRRFARMVAAMLLGSVVFFALGLAQLSRFVPREHLLAAGLLPFITGDLIKSALAALAFPRVWRWAQSHTDAARGGPEA
jgi:biotin transport system substrate-specific component